MRMHAFAHDQNLRACFTEFSMGLKYLERTGALKVLHYPDNKFAVLIAMFVS